jgi:hypothetical protein
MTLSQADFTRVVELILTTARVEYERRELQEFVAAAWPLIGEDPWPARWAREFLESGPVAVPAAGWGFK